ncbi:MAG: hypothetical protein EHM47_18090, partial [Ignavibacteriales bacterium]
MLKVLITFLTFTSVLLSGNDEIKEKINSFLAKLPSSTKMSILIINPMGEDTLYSSGHTMPMIPASNTKLFTTAVALSVMGGDFELATKFLTDDNNL